MPATATGDSFYGNTVEFGGRTEPTAAIRLSNLDPSIVYALGMFASREASDNRQTQYRCEGAESSVSYLNASSNRTKIAECALKPHADGTIELHVGRGPENTNSNGFYYLGALTIRFESDSKAEPGLNLVRPVGGEFWQVGRTARVEWKSTTRDSVAVEFSADGGAAWERVATLASSTKILDWTVPDRVTTQALVKVSSAGLDDVSPMPFEISSNTDICTVVVLGSSTAEGTGPSVPDSARVQRYRQANVYRDTRHQVHNLARGGYTTFHILPTGSTAGSQVGVNVDTQRNITRALSLDPDAIIVNMPSNDASSGYSVAAQLANFDAVAAAASSDGVPVWITTTQPRNGFNANQIAIQRAVRDSILAIHGERGIDVWTGFADGNGGLLEAYDSGDGVHMNNEGHRILYERISEKVVMDQVCARASSTEDVRGRQPAPIPDRIELAVYPNPFNPGTNLAFRLDAPAQVVIQVYNVLGQRVRSVADRPFGAGSHVVSWDGLDDAKSDLGSGTYFFHLSAGGRETVAQGLLVK